MSYPQNADEVLGLNGLKFATGLSIVQMAVVFFFFIRTTIRLTEAQLSAIPQPLVINAFFILLSSLAVTLALATTSAKRAYKKYDQKAKFEEMMYQLLSSVATNESMSKEGKVSFMSYYLNVLARETSTQHLMNMPNNPGKHMLRDVILQMLKETGARLKRQIDDNNGMPSSGMVAMINMDLARLEAMRSAIDTKQPLN